jgi:signal transduction histidine kinase
MNKIYDSLHKIPFLKKSYNLKFLFIAFLGIHIPLIGIIIFLLNNKSDSFSSFKVILITLLFTLIAAIITLIVLNKLLAPLTASKMALKNFSEENKLPNLPTIYKDEAGQLMSLIQQTLSSLDALGKEKQQITALVSHNLRTPLNQILGLSELMEIDKENSHVYLESIIKITKSQLNSLSELLNQLMNNNLNLAISKDKFNLTELINEESEKLALDYKNKNLRIEIQNPDKVHYISSNRSKIALIIHNLLSNALKFSFEGQKVTIKISQKNERTLIKVSDTGVGFNEDYKQMLFKDARNMGRTGTEDEPSVGLGLHLCKRTIQQINGDLIAESAGTNKGASFTIVI